MGDSLSFLALSLDSPGRPIPIANTDPATELFLGGFATDTGRARCGPSRCSADVEPFARDYPVGLFVGGLGPVVANDAYADAARCGSGSTKDAYHSPRVVWGREVNLLLLGPGAIGCPTPIDAAGQLRDPTLEPLRRCPAAMP